MLLQMATLEEAEALLEELRGGILGVLSVLGPRCVRCVRLH